MFKKIALGLIGIVALLAVAGGALFVMNGSDNYDATKYNATVTDGMNTGSKMSFTLPDQFDKTHTLNDDTKVLILSFTKETGHTVKDYIVAQNDDNYLSDKNAMFIADISKTPIIIRNTFVLPGLQKSPSPVLLIYDKTIAAQIKNDTKADKIAVLTLENGTITDTKYLTTADELKTALN